MKHIKLTGAGTYQYGDDKFKKNEVKPVTEERAEYLLGTGYFKEADPGEIPEGEPRGLLEINQEEQDLHQGTAEGEGAQDTQDSQKEEAADKTPEQQSAAAEEKPKSAKKKVK